MCLLMVISVSFCYYFIFFSNAMTRSLPSKLEREIRPNRDFILANKKQQLPACWLTAVHSDGDVIVERSENKGHREMSNFTT